MKRYRVEFALEAQEDIESSFKGAMRNGAKKQPFGGIES